VQAANDRVYVTISGLSDNFEKAVALLEERLADPVMDVATYLNLVTDVLKGRDNAKLSQYTVFSRLTNYAQWGPQSALTNIPSAADLKGLKPDELIKRIKSLKNFEHTILYYGPLAKTEVVEAINRLHIVADHLQPVPAPVKYVEQATDRHQVLLAHYDANQIYMSIMSKGVVFDRAIEPARIIYSMYFGGSMSGIVFQEMREARGLAYSAYADYGRPSKPEYSYYLNAFIATQNDKMKDAVDAFKSILNDMPESEITFGIAKENLLTNYRTQRVLRENILWNYLNGKRFGYSTDSRKELYEKVLTMTLADVKAFQEKYVKDLPYTYCILGDTKNLSQDHLRSFGAVRRLSLEEIFGY
jgi:predicted Zn-dependent peptidase